MSSVTVADSLCLTVPPVLCPCPASCCPALHPPPRCSVPAQDNFLASFLLGWCITIGAGLASYPIDTVRRRMMMTSGQAVKYKSSIDCFQQVCLFLFFGRGGGGESSGGRGWGSVVWEGERLAVGRSAALVWGVCVGGGAVR